MIKLQYLESGTQSVLTSAEQEEITQLLEAKFRPFLKSEIFLLETGYSKLQTQVRCTLAKSDGSVAYPIEAVCVLRNADETDGLLSTKDQFYAMLDLLDAYFTEYLQQGRDTYLGLDWQPFESGVYTVCLRGFVRNLEVERLTDAWLAEKGNGHYAIEAISSVR